MNDHTFTGTTGYRPDYVKTYETWKELVERPDGQQDIGPAALSRECR